ncbi:MAG: enoyl-CoA hydratase/isomerase family protein [Alphaproteobacteria bacterium]|nr:enoyl-CoA hydratase/isomerase family protein [Alphaproteobacteria bacterium]
MSTGTTGTARGGVLLSEREGAVLTLAVNRPEATNAIDNMLRDELTRALDEVAANKTVRALVLTSVGDEAFSVGMDIGELAAFTPLEIELVAVRARGIYERLAALEIPIIAAIKGACLGAGFELALHADVRLARADARFGLPGINVGMNANGGALARLQRISGNGSAAALALTGGVVTAERAFMLGLVSNVAGMAEFEPSVQQLAAHMAQLSPVAVAETKKLLRLAAERGIEAAAEHSPKGLARCFAEGDAAMRLQMMLGGRDPEATVH